MNGKTIKFSMGFHRFLINGALWFMGIGMIIVGGMNIHYAIEDRVMPVALTVALQVILILSGILLLKGRFDLAKMKTAGIKEILIACLAAAAVFLYDWRVNYYSGELVENSFLFPLLSACWGIAIYRYYRQFEGILN